MGEREISLLVEQELRIELDYNEEIQVVLESGNAEIFGEELPVKSAQTFTGPCKFAIFTWHGSVLHITGNASVEYKSETATPMQTYLHLHGEVNKARYEACRNRTVGPKVLVAGSISSGKSTLCQILTNYGIKCGWKPIFVELDSSSNDMFIPGTISAKSNRQMEQPIAYYYGHYSISHSKEDNYKAFYNRLIGEMATTVTTRMEHELDYVKTNYPNSYDINLNTFASGCVINFPSAGDDAILRHIVETFNIDYVFILDSERMVSSLRGGSGYTLYNSLPKSGGVVNIDADARQRLRLYRLETFFSNFPGRKISLSFDEVMIYKISRSVVNIGMLPIGEAGIIGGSSKIPVQASQQTLLNTVLGVLHADNIDSSPLAGVVHVREVDDVTRKFQVWAPGDLPSKTFILGSIKWLKT